MIDELKLQRDKKHNLIDAVITLIVLFTLLVILGFVAGYLFVSLASMVNINIYLAGIVSALVSFLPFYLLWKLIIPELKKSVDALNEYIG